MSKDVANVETPEIEVTPAMIEAGVNSLKSHYHELRSSLEDVYPKIVETLYRSMAAVR